MYFLLILLMLLVAALAYKRVYFKPISVVKLSTASEPCVITVKPNKKWFRSIGSGAPVGIVRLSSDILCIYVDKPGESRLAYKGYTFSGDVYLLRYSKLKFASVDLSDRVLADCLQKFDFTI